MLIVRNIDTALKINTNYQQYVLNWKAEIIGYFYKQ